MIIRNFNMIGITRFPLKAYPPLAIDAYAVLSLPFTLQRFQSVSRRYAKVGELSCRIKKNELLACNILDILRHSA